MFDMLLAILDSTIRVSTPLLLVCLAGLYSERAGIIDIGLEGKLLGAAFGAAAAAAALGSVWAGMMVGIAVSVALALIHGVACITYRGNQIVSGVAINFLAAGLTGLLGQAWFHQGGRTPPLSGDARWSRVDLPFVDSVAGVPIVGPIYADLLSGHYLLVYVAFAAAPFTWWVLHKTRFGLRLRAVGENPAAVDTAGISVARMRYLAVICAGILCGLAGSYLATGLSAGFIKDMSAGRGYIALAALIFAKWRPLQAVAATLLFGFLDASAIFLQGTTLPLVGEIPVQLIQSVPYILTVILLAGFIGKAVPPKAGGAPYVKER
jgi:simple sugar transport system permease protein